MAIDSKTPGVDGNTTLLAIVEVNKEERVLCQAPGCGHSVYKRIHVLKIADGYSVVGSECFKRIYLNLPPESSSPKYFSTDGRPLSAINYELLVNNTAEFIRRLEQERVNSERVYAEQMERQRQERDRRREEWHQTQERLQRQALELEEVRRAAMGDAKKSCQKLYPTLNLDSPGWQGLVYVEMLRMVRLGERRNSSSDSVPYKEITRETPRQTGNWSLFDDEA